MSSAEEDYNDGNNTGRDAKKRRVQRACDMCRRKKVRCDGGQMPGNKCSNCLAYNMDCTYVEAAKKRGPPKGYVEGLEHRLEKMQALLNQLCPNADFTKELGPAIDRESWPRERHTSHSDGRASIHPPPYPDAVGENTNTESPEGFESSDDDALQLEGLHEQMKDFHVGSRFFGKSSGVRLIKTAMDFKMEYSGKGNPIFSSSAFGDRSCRQEFWTMHPWEDLSNWYSTDHARLYAFPDPDLLAHLVDLYFENQNNLYPLLHRPTFERTLQEASHLKDEGTGAVVLLVCAIGSRYSNDPRVRMDGEESWGSSGWKWFQQVRLARKSFLIPPALCDIQIFSLACIFLQGCSAPQVCWTLCGVGIRLAQDVGAHRKKVYSTTRKVEDELWRRAFWVLVAIDREMSASLGRPCAIQEEDFDLDFPVDCDDEYWEHPDPKQAFKQPPGKPSKVAFFISYIRLNQILSFALRTIYSINKSKALLGFVGPEWDQRIVAELDSTLNKWLDEIPSHLHWPPAADGPSLFFRQSAVLYTEYYELQIMVHRPFIPSTQKPSKLSFPSLAICTNAARACSHIVDSVLRRFPGQPTFEFQLPAFTAAIVLLLHIWGHKRAGQTSTGVNLEAEMQCVHHCMQALKASETRWHTAGRLWDVLYELASVGDLPLPAATFNAKRERDEDDGPDTGSSPASVSGAPSLSPAIPTAHNGERIIAGSRRAHAAASHVAVPVPASAAVQHTPSPFDLPVHTNELGGLGGAAWFGGAPPPSTDPRVYGMSQDVGFVSQQRQQQQPQAVPFAPMHTGGMSRMGDMQVAGVGNPGAAPPGMFDSMMVGMTSEGSGAQSSSVDMWSNVPTGYGFEDWDSYITNISWMQQPGMGGQQQQQSQPPMR